jgi:hypothetical protein
MPHGDAKRHGDEHIREITERKEPAVLSGCRLFKEM